MDIKVLKEIAYKHMGNRKAHLEREKGFIYYHGLRVSKLSLILREAILPGDASHDDIIVAASLFHDIGKGMEPHGKYGAVLVKDILIEYCTELEIAKIAEIIYCHNLRKKSNDYSEYIKIVQDADILDHFGTIEIWMNFQYYAYKDEPMQNSIEFYHNEYDALVQDCRGQLNYEVSLKIFDEKVAFGYSFIARFKKETEGEICIEI
ncbi:MAG TPA: HD domain-containing protein [Clostridiaceae bacterium]